MIIIKFYKRFNFSYLLHYVSNVYAIYVCECCYLSTIFLLFFKEKRVSVDSLNIVEMICLNQKPGFSPIRINSLPCSKTFVLSLFMSDETSLEQVRHIGWHLLDAGIVKGFNVLKCASVFFCYKINRNTFASKTATTTDSGKKWVKQKIVF